MSYDQSNLPERMGAVYKIPCPCCGCFLELVCYSSGHHTILPTQHIVPQIPVQSMDVVKHTSSHLLSPTFESSHAGSSPSPAYQSTAFPRSSYNSFANSTFGLKSEIASFEKIRLGKDEEPKPSQPYEPKKNFFPNRSGRKDKQRSSRKRCGSSGHRSKNKDAHGWGTEKVEWFSDYRNASRKDSANDSRANEKTYPLTAAAIWENSLCEQYKFDGGCDLLEKKENLLDSLRISKSFEHSRSCDGIDRDNVETASKSSGSRCGSYFSDADLSCITEHSVESWYASFRKQNKDYEWDRGFLITVHKTSNNHFIGIELLTVRRGRVCIPLTLSELNDLKKSFVYKFRYIHDEGFEVKPDVTQYSFVNELVALPKNQIAVVVPGLVSYSNYTLEEMKARKEKLHIWCDSVGFVNFSVELIEYWNSKRRCSIFEPLTMVSLHLLSRWESDCMADERASNPDWEVIDVKPLETSQMSRHLESCYPREVFRFDDLRVVRKNDKKYSTVLESMSHPYLTISAHPSQCLLDIDRVKPGEVLTAIVAPRYSSNEVFWQALIVGQIERIVSVTNDRISFYAPKNQPATKTVDPRIIEYVKQI